MAVAAERLIGRNRTATSEKPSTPLEVFSIGNGKDFAYPYPDGSRPKRAYRYEDRCFREVATSPEPGSLDVGPYAIDRFFSNELPINVRPDIMRFIRRRSPSGKFELVLRRLFEVRAGDLDLTRKLNGFEEFLGHVRGDGHLFRLFQLLEIQGTSVVPETKQVSVTFITPKGREDTVYEDTRFAKVDFRKIG